MKTFFFLEITSFFAPNCSIFSVYFGLHKTGIPWNLSSPRAHFWSLAPLLGATTPLSQVLKNFNQKYKRLNLFWVWPESKKGWAILNLPSEKTAQQQVMLWYVYYNQRFWVISFIAWNVSTIRLLYFPQVTTFDLCLLINYEQISSGQKWKPVGLPVGSRFFDRPVKPVETPVKFFFLASKRHLSTNQNIHVYSIINKTFYKKVVLTNHTYWKHLLNGFKLWLICCDL